MERQNGGDGCGGCLALFLVLIAVSLVIVAIAWFVSFIGHAIHLTPTYPEMDRHGYTWIKERYENVPTGYVLTSLALLGGVPLCVALTAELVRPQPRARHVLLMAAPLVALVAAIAFVPAGAR